MRHRWHRRGRGRSARRGESADRLEKLRLVLLISISGVIAMLIPYATEIYPVNVRGTGTGVIAGSSKVGGIVAARLGVTGFFAGLTGSAIGVAVPSAALALMLAITGIETRGRSLEEIHSRKVLASWARSSR